jgi:hypothetical protein
MVDANSSHNDKTNEHDTTKGTESTIHKQQSEVQVASKAYVDNLTAQRNLNAYAKDLQVLDSLCNLGNPTFSQQLREFLEKIEREIKSQEQRNGDDQNQEYLKKLQNVLTKAEELGFANEISKLEQLKISGKTQDYLEGRKKLSEQMEAEIKVLKERGAAPERLNELDSLSKVLEQIDKTQDVQVLRQTIKGPSDITRLLGETSSEQFMILGTEKTADFQQWIDKQQSKEEHLDVSDSQAGYNKDSQGRVTDFTLPGGKISYHFTYEGADKLPEKIQSDQQVWLRKPGTNDYVSGDQKIYDFNIESVQGKCPEQLEYTDSSGRRQAVKSDGDREVIDAAGNRQTLGPDGKLKSISIFVPPGATERNNLRTYELRYDESGKISGLQVAQGLEQPQLFDVRNGQILANGKVVGSLSLSPGGAVAVHDSINHTQVNRSKDGAFHIEPYIGRPLKQGETAFFAGDGKVYYRDNKGADHLYAEGKGETRTLDNGGTVTLTPDGKITKLEFPVHPGKSRETYDFTYGNGRITKYVHHTQDGKDITFTSRDGKNWQGSNGEQWSGKIEPTDAPAVVRSVDIPGSKEKEVYVTTADGVEQHQGPPRDTTRDEADRVKLTNETFPKYKEAKELLDQLSTHNGDPEREQKLRDLFTNMTPDAIKMMKQMAEIDHYPLEQLIMDKAHRLPPEISLATAHILERELNKDSATKQTSDSRPSTANDTTVQQTPDAKIPSPNNLRVDYDKLDKSAEGIHTALHGLWRGDSDYEKVDNILKGMNQTEREELKKLYKEKFGSELESEFKENDTDAQQDKALNLLNRRDGDAGDAGRIHTALTELHQWIDGRSSGNCEQDIRDTLRTLNSLQLARLEEQYEHQYGKSLHDAICNEAKVSPATKASVEIYLKGTDKRTDTDTQKLIDISLSIKDVEIFKQTMADASPEARKSFLDNGGAERMKSAFDGHWYNLLKYYNPFHPFLQHYGASQGSDANITDTDLKQAEDYAKYGKESVVTKIRENIGHLSNNDEAIEKALKDMSPEEHSQYALGRTLATQNADKSKLSESEEKALQFYTNLHQAIVDTAPRQLTDAKITKWADMAEVPGGSLVAKIKSHYGIVGDGRAAVLREIDNMSAQDWQYARNHPEYRARVLKALKDQVGVSTQISQADVDNAMKAYDAKISVDAYERSQILGNRPLLERLEDDTHYYRNDRKAMVEEIIHMSAEEQANYRTNSSYRNEIDLFLKTQMGTNTPGYAAAKRLLTQVANNEPPEPNLVAKLEIRAQEKEDTKAKILAAEVGTGLALGPLGLPTIISGTIDAATGGTAVEAQANLAFGSLAADSIRDIQEEFRKNPQLQERIMRPQTDEDRQFSAAFFKAAHLAFSNTDYQKYAEPLIKTGKLSADLQLELNKGVISNDKVGTVKGLLNLPAEEKLAILTNPAYQQKALGFLSDADRKVALSVLRNDDSQIHPADEIRLRLNHLGGSDNIMDTLRQLKDNPTAVEQMKFEYAHKYSSDLTSDLLDKLSTKDKLEAERILRTPPSTGRQAYNDARDQYYDSNDGIGKAVVNNIWDGTGRMTEDALNQFSARMAQEAAKFKELPVAEQKRLMDKLHEAINLFIDSKGAAADSVVNAAIAIVAIGGTVVTGGVSLGLLAAVGGGGAALQVLVDSAIMGSDYDWSAKGITKDAVIGAINGLVNVIGPGEIAQLFKVGEQAAIVAAEQAIKEAGEAVLKQGGKEALEAILKKQVRDAITEGSFEITEKALDGIVQQVAKQGATDAEKQAFKQALKDALINEIDKKGRSIIENAAIKYGFNMAGGAAGGGIANLSSALMEWDGNKSVADNMAQIGKSVAAGVASGAIGAAGFTLVFHPGEAAFEYLKKHYNLKPNEKFSDSQLAEIAKTTGLKDAKMHNDPNGALVLEGHPDVPKEPVKPHADGPSQTKASNVETERTKPGETQPKDNADSTSTHDKPATTKPFDPNTPEARQRVIDSSDQTNDLAFKNKLEGQMKDGTMLTEAGVDKRTGEALGSQAPILFDRVGDTKLAAVLSSDQVAAIKARRIQGMGPEQQLAAIMKLVQETNPLTSEADYINFLKSHSDRKIPLGELIDGKPPRGTCATQSMLFKAIADEVGLEGVTLERGSVDGSDRRDHMWLRIKGKDGVPDFIYDPANNIQGKATDLAVEGLNYTCRSVENREPDLKLKPGDTVSIGNQRYIFDSYDEKGNLILYKENFVRTPEGKLQQTKEYLPTHLTPAEVHIKDTQTTSYRAGSQRVPETVVAIYKPTLDEEAVIRKLVRKDKPYANWQKAVDELIANKAKQGKELTLEDYRNLARQRNNNENVEQLAQETEKAVKGRKPSEIEAERIQAESRKMNEQAAIRQQNEEKVQKLLQDTKNPAPDLGKVKTELLESGRLGLIAQGEVQDTLKQAAEENGLVLLASAPGTAADKAGADYILIDPETGRWLPLDVSMKGGMFDHSAGTKQSKPQLLLDLINRSPERIKSFIGNVSNKVKLLGMDAETLPLLSKSSKEDTLEALKRYERGISSIPDSELQKELSPGLKRAYAHAEMEADLEIGARGSIATIYDGETELPKVMASPGETRQFKSGLGTVRVLYRDGHIEISVSVGGKNTAFDAGEIRNLWKQVTGSDIPAGQEPYVASALLDYFAEKPELFAVGLSHNRQAARARWGLQQDGTAKPVRE